MADAWQKRRAAAYAGLMLKLKRAPCLDCGGSFPPECMDFDHVRGDKKKNISRMQYAAGATLLAEVAKCELVCANCHRIRTLHRAKRARNALG